MRESGMASSPDVVEYICFQLRHAGDISFRKMFGDYGLYCGRTFFGLVCDNQLYVKITAGHLGQSILPMIKVLLNLVFKDCIQISELKQFLLDHIMRGQKSLKDFSKNFKKALENFCQVT